MGLPNYTDSCLSETIRLRSILKRKVLYKFNTSLRILDSCCAVPKASEATIETKLIELKKLTLPDGVHVSYEGSVNIASNILDGIKILQNGVEAKASSVSAGVHVTGGASYFWRGFTSPNGFRTHHSMPVWSKSDKSLPHKQYGPYMGKWTRDRRKW